MFEKLKNLGFNISEGNVATLRSFTGYAEEKEWGIYLKNCTFNLFGKKTNSLNFDLLNRTNELSYGCNIINRILDINSDDKLNFDDYDEDLIKILGIGNIKSSNIENKTFAICGLNFKVYSDKHYQAPKFDEIKENLKFINFNEEELINYYQKEFDKIVNMFSVNCKNKITKNYLGEETIIYKSNISDNENFDFDISFCDKSFIVDGYFMNALGEKCDFVNPEYYEDFICFYSNEELKNYIIKNSKFELIGNYKPQKYAYNISSVFIDFMKKLNVNKAYLYEWYKEDVYVEFENKENIIQEIKIEDLEDFLIYNYKKRNNLFDFKINSLEEIHSEKSLISYAIDNIKELKEYANIILKNNSYKIIYGPYSDIFFEKEFINIIKNDKIFKNFNFLSYLKLSSPEYEKEFYYDGSAFCYIRDKNFVKNANVFPVMCLAENKYTNTELTIPYCLSLIFKDNIEKIIIPYDIY